MRQVDQQTGEDLGDARRQHQEQRAPEEQKAAL
jgi:hypothetical protein